MKRRAWLFAPLALAAAVALGGCATTANTPKSLADTLASQPQFSTFAKLAAESGLADTLRGAGPYTVFAPTDAAFAKLPAKTLGEITGDKARLKEVLSFHVVPGALTGASIKAGNVKSVQGSDLALARAGNFVTVEEAVVTEADIGATNGVVQAIDTVLQPPKKK